MECENATLVFECLGHIIGNGSAAPVHSQLNTTTALQCYGCFGKRWLGLRNQETQLTIQFGRSPFKEYAIFIEVLSLCWVGVRSAKVSQSMLRRSSTKMKVAFLDSSKGWRFCI